MDELHRDSATIGHALSRIGVFLLAAAPYAIGAACLGVAAWFVAGLF